MIPLQIALTALCLLSAVWLVVLIVRDRTPDRVLLNVLAVVELALVVHLVLGIVRVTGRRPGRRLGSGSTSATWSASLLLDPGRRDVVVGGAQPRRHRRAPRRGADRAVHVRPAGRHLGRRWLTARPRRAPDAASARVLVFVYGVFALAATGRSALQLATKASEAPVPVRR